jgi:hypothetical protein
MSSFVFSFGEGHVFDGYSIIEVAEGINLSQSHIREYCTAVKSILLGKPHIGIFQYTKPFNFSPDFYSGLNQSAAVIGIGFVSRDDKTFCELETLRDSVEHIPMMPTTSLDDAVSWAKLQLKKHRH